MLEMRFNKSSRVHKYRTRPVYTGFARSAPNLILSISPFTPSCWHLVVTCLQAQATQVDHKYSMKREIETHDVFYRSSTSIETYSPLRRLWATHHRSALEDHEGHSSQSLFQLLFLLPLVDSFPCGGGIELLQTSRGTPQSLGCSPATPSRLESKSPRVTNANHKIDNMHKCSRVACSQF